jgi:hypothetical protein
MGNYAKDEMETEKEVNLFMNTNNDESYCDNQSSYYETNVRENMGNYNNFTSTDMNNFCDFKFKGDLDNESKYNNFNKDPK